ncbi:MAG: hypothetical protein AAGK14_09055 [Verrucomicrobiota bacterium]
MLLTLACPALAQESGEEGLDAEVAVEEEVIPPTPQELELYSKLLEQLKAMEQSRNLQVDASINRLQSEIRRLISNPRNAVKAYLDAVEYTRFAGKPGGDDRFDRWKERYAIMHEDRLFEEAVVLQLQYLLMSLELRKSNDPMKQRAFLMGQLIDYAERLEEWDKEVMLLENPEDARDIPAIKKRTGGQKAQDFRQPLKDPLSQSPIVKQFQLEEHIGGVDNWEPVPGNLDGVMDTNVMWFLREREDPRLLRMWPERLAYKERLAKVLGSTSAMDRFENLVKPGMLWQYSVDTFKLGSKSEALKRMMMVLQQYPEHANYQNWSAELLALLQGEIAKAPSVPEPSDSDGAAPSPPASTAETPTESAPTADAPTEDTPPGNQSSGSATSDSPPLSQAR